MIGPAILVKLPVDLLKRLDERAAQIGVSRAEIIRRLLDLALRAPRT